MEINLPIKAVEFESDTNTRGNVYVTFILTADEYDELESHHDLGLFWDKDDEEASTPSPASDYPFMSIETQLRVNALSSAITWGLSINALDDKEHDVPYADAESIVDAAEAFYDFLKV